MASAPAYRIETERCVLRCFELTDARALHALVHANRAHLAPWLAWAREEPRSLAEHLELVRAFRQRFDGDSDYAYALLERERGLLLGSVALHPIPDEPLAATLGYWIAHEHAGRGLATEAVSAVVRSAFEAHRLARVEIHCDASNARSRALADRLGFHLDAELRGRGHAPGEARAVHSLLAAEYPESPAVSRVATAHDALGDVLFEPPAPRRSGFR
ncbi:MAG: GNAT family protein [Planctomycetota bacterium]|nr:GNAT family protein [Planctomycetota bacterium]